MAKKDMVQEMSEYDPIKEAIAKWWNNRFWRTLEVLALILGAVGEYKDMEMMLIFAIYAHLKDNCERQTRRAQGVEP